MYTTTTYQRPSSNDICERVVPSAVLGNSFGVCNDLSVREYNAKAQLGRARCWLLLQGRASRLELGATVRVITAPQVRR